MHSEKNFFFYKVFFFFFYDATSHTSPGHLQRPTVVRIRPFQHTHQPRSPTHPPIHTDKHTHTHTEAHRHTHAHIFHAQHTPTHTHAQTHTPHTHRLSTFEEKKKSFSAERSMITAFSARNEGLIEMQQHFSAQPLSFHKHPFPLLHSSLLAQQECPSSVSDQ